MKPLVYAMPGNEAFAGALAAAWPADLAAVDLHRFPDGESLVRLDEPPRGRDVAIVCTLHEPDASLLPLIFAAGAARDLGARSVGLVAPYLAYMRQDRRFQDGQAVSAPQFGRLLSQHFDWLACVDPHLHRIHALGEIYSIPTREVKASPLLADWIAHNVERPLLIGPDAESRQWIERIARAAHVPSLVLEKSRHGDRDVGVAVPELRLFSDHTPVLADDIISSGGTMIEVTKALVAQGLRAPVCVAVHAVFAPFAYWGLLEAGASRIVTANTIPHPSNGIDVSLAVAEACRELAGGGEAVRKRSWANASRG
jgi:ribose-phosphate pyrophosphokinase